MLSFLCFFILFIAEKTRLEINIFLSFYLMPPEKNKYLKGYISEKFFTTKKLWDGLLVFRK